MSPLLIELTVRGSAVLLAASIADFLWARSMTAHWRRIWWLLVPLAFLWPGSLRPTLPAYVIGYNGLYLSPSSTTPIPVHHEFDLDSPISFSAGALTSHAFSGLAAIWLVGLIVSALFVIIPTWKVQRHWSAKRLSTDPALLNLLEDAKATAGVTAPIGLIVCDAISAPALLGWLRPRILIPSQLAADSPHELRAVLLHELAHFKSLDIPLNWLFTVVRVVHWFNPLAWLAAAAWQRFREEAADESAIRWLREPGATAYGEILLKTLGKCSRGSAPYGALAIGESITNLKRRVLMIRNYPSKTNRTLLALLVILTLAALMALSPTLTRADGVDQDAEKKDAVAAMQTWLAEMDSGNYAQSWSDSAKMFRDAVTSDKWVALSTNVRKPLGKLVSRNFASAAYQAGVLSTAADASKNVYVVAQFDTSFENMKYVRETVTFQKEADGKWREAGYYIKPQ